MKKKIVAIIDGNIDTLLANWKPPEKVEYDREEDHLEIVFDDDSLPEYRNLEAAVERLKSNHSLELGSLFRAYDFTKIDLEKSELLWMQVLLFSELELAGVNPVKETRCPVCSRVHSKLQKTEKIEMITHKRIPKSYIIGTLYLDLFHNDLLKMLREKGMDGSLQSIPCSIKTGENEVIDDYSCVYSTADLGLEAGGMFYGAPCKECGRPEVLNNESFIHTYERKKWQGKDFCTSTFLGPDFLYVSQQVYQLIVSLPEEAREGVIFNPVDLE